jgi:hypothetical protein
MSTLGVIDPENYLSIEFNKFQSQMRQLALSDPKNYFALQQKVSTDLKTAAVKNLYATIYWFMKEGTKATADGKSDTSGTGAIIKDSAGTVYRPSYPVQKINQEALDITNTLNEYLDDLIEKIIPTSFTKIAEIKSVVNAQK